MKVTIGGHDKAPRPPYTHCASIYIAVHIHRERRGLSWRLWGCLAAIPIFSSKTEAIRLAVCLCDESEMLSGFCHFCDLSGIAEGLFEEILQLPFRRYPHCAPRVQKLPFDFTEIEKMWSPTCGPTLGNRFKGVMPSDFGKTPAEKGNIANRVYPCKLTEGIENIHAVFRLQFPLLSGDRSQNQGHAPEPQLRSRAEFSSGRL